MSQPASVACSTLSLFARHPPLQVTTRTTVPSLRRLCALKITCCRQPINFSRLLYVLCLSQRATRCRMCRLLCADTHIGLLSWHVRITRRNPCWNTLSSHMSALLICVLNSPPDLRKYTYTTQALPYHPHKRRNISRTIKTYA